MEIIRENEIKLDNGHVVKIVTISNKYEYATRTYEILVDEKDNAITPEVKSIKFDKEHQMFFVRDKLPIDEYFTGSINYYINYQGIPIGLCFFDLTNGFFNMDFKSSDDYKRRYFNFKMMMTDKIRKEVAHKVEVDTENCKKMALYKKGMIESENQI